MGRAFSKSKILLLGQKIAGHPRDARRFYTQNDII